MISSGSINLGIQKFSLIKNLEFRFIPAFNTGDLVSETPTSERLVQKYRKIDSAYLQLAMDLILIIMFKKSVFGLNQN